MVAAGGVSRSIYNRLLREAEIHPEADMARTSSYGICQFCKKRFSKGTIARHLQSCASREWTELSRRKNPRRKKTRVFHLLVEGRHLKAYWLHLEVPANQTLAELDFFLRGIWLECCGHLSQFTIGGERYLVSPSPFQFGGEPDRDMNVPLGKVLSEGLRFEYEYDFGSTTSLALRVLGEAEDATRDEVLLVLARNEPPERPCSECGKPAVEVCAECGGGWEPGAWFCQDCVAEHGCGEEMLMPVVNSPRMGVCGYTSKT
jgi:hypothetical protein